MVVYTNTVSVKKSGQTLQTAHVISQGLMEF
jgi:hypothetical protein